VIAAGQTGGATARAAFRIVPGVSLARGAGPPGSANRLSGNGFAAHEKVTAHWASPGGPLLGAAVADAQGSFTGAHALAFKVPPGPGRTFRVYAVGSTSKARAFATFKVMPALALSPAAGKPGSQVSVTGVGFGAGEAVRVSFTCLKPPCPSRLLGTATANARGDLLGLKATIPTVRPGVYGIEGRDSRAHDSAEARFAVR
jgi:hypothetical protein